jgi:hypothetical protein
MRDDDGRIFSNRDYWDMATFLHEVGALPAAGRVTFLTRRR